jgi:hypothetical protein
MVMPLEWRKSNPIPVDFLPRSLLLQPRLEHEDVPEVVLPVAVAGLVFLPLLADGGGVEVAFSFGKKRWLTTILRV